MMIWNNKHCSIKIQYLTFKLNPQTGSNIEVLKLLQKYPSTPFNNIYI